MSSLLEVESSEPLLVQDDSDQGRLPLAKNRRNELPGWTPWLVLSITACVTGSSFQFGYNTGVVNVPQKILEEFLNETNIYRTGHPMSKSTTTVLFSSVVAVFCLGGMIGGLCGGYVANKFGRKKAMMMNNVLVWIGSALQGCSKLAHSYEMLIAGRFIMGIHSGLSTGIAPMYLSEVAPINLRGAAGTVHQFAIVLAVLVSQILGLPQLLGTENRWPFLLAFPVVTSVLQLISLPLCPESPRHCVMSDDDEEAARRGLIQLRGTDSVENDLMEIRRENEQNKQMSKISIPELFKHNSLLQPTIISVVMQLSQQFSGINGVMYYSTSIFEHAKLSLDAALYGTLGVGALNVAVTFVSVILIDIAGRRTLHLSGLGGMWVCSLLITTSFLFSARYPAFSYVGIALVIGYVLSFAIGPGSIPWFIVAELFAQNARGAAVSISVLVNWFSQAVIALAFPQFQAYLKNYVFLPFAGLLTLFWIFTYVKVPETKGKTIEEISSTFRSRRLMTFEVDEVEND